MACIDIQQLIPTVLSVEQQDEQQHTDQRPWVHPQSLQREGERVGHCCHKGNSFNLDTKAFYYKGIFMKKEGIRLQWKGYRNLFSLVTKKIFCILFWSPCTYSL